MFVSRRAVEFTTATRTLLPQQVIVAIRDYSSTGKVTRSSRGVKVMPRKMVKLSSPDSVLASTEDGVKVASIVGQNATAAEKTEKQAAAAEKRKRINKILKEAKELDESTLVDMRLGRPLEIDHGEVLEQGDEEIRELKVGPDEHKERIDKSMRRDFWASQMAMRESLKKDGGEFLVDEELYQDTLDSYKKLGSRLMDTRAKQRAIDATERAERDMERAEESRRLMSQRTDKWSKLPLPEEFGDVADEAEEDYEDDGLPDMTRIEVETTAPLSDELLAEYMARQKKALMEEAEENADDDFEKRRKLKRIEFMSNKLALQEKQRQERLKRIGVNEEEQIEIDPAVFKRYAAGEITEEEMRELSKRQVEEEQNEDDEVSLDEKYTFLKHWKIGSIEVPPVLKRKIAQALKGAPTAQLRKDSSELSDRLRDRTRSMIVDKVTPIKVTPEDKPVIVYGKGQALAYIAHRMPGVFACTKRVFEEIARRVPNFQPTTMLDYGSGPGTVIWSARETWSSLEQIKAIEPSAFMVDIAKKMLEGDTNSIRWNQVLIKPQSNIIPLSLQNELVVASYVLSELPDEASRRALVIDLWRHVKPSGMLVILEPGTPIGFGIVKDTRQLLLDLGSEQITEHRSTKAQVLAPCPHSDRCPMGHNSWCHFSQRVVRPVFQKLAKGPASTVPFEDEKYSYIVMTKMVQSTISNQLEKQTALYGDEVEPIKPWSRINEAPFKRGGHVTMDVCSPTGELRRVTIAKSSGKQFYKEARKSFWSDGIIIDDSKVTWIPSRNQLVETEVELAAAAEREKEKSTIVFRRKDAEKELKKVIEMVDTKPKTKKQLLEESTKAKDEEWMKDLAQTDRKMLQKLVREGKFSPTAKGLFGEEGEESAPTIRGHADYIDMTKNDKAMEFTDDGNKPVVKNNREFRDSSKSRASIKQRLIEDMEVMSRQNLQPDELEMLPQRPVTKRPPKKGTMDAFIEEELANDNNQDDDGDDGDEGARDLLNDEQFKQIMEKKRQQQLKATSMVESVQGMGINTKNNRDKKGPRMKPGLLKDSKDE
eukprot:gene14578-17236_t